MLTPDEIAALREYSLLLTQPVNDFLLKDIARRVAKAGQLTSTAEYQMCRAQFLGADMPKLKENIETLVSEAGLQIDNLFKFVESKSLDFAENRQLQQITAAYLKASKKDLETLLKTKNIGFVAPDGHVYPLQNAYLKTMDYAVRQVITGAADYNTAIRQATKRLADSGIRTLPQKNGRNIGIEYAVRRYVMNNISAVATNINEANHDAMGADGWELSAHAASAPDHEPFQGQQFTDKEYSELNNSLVRRIGTLSCKHIAYPIILGISRPAHSEAELKRYVKENADGITYQGQHYTLYQAAQIQRGIENEIRHQKNKSLIAKNLGDKESLQSAQIKLNILKEEYNRFSSAAGLRTSSARMQVPGFDRSAAARASWMYKNQHVFYADTVKNKTARIISSIREDNKYVKYNKLPEDYRKRFEIGLENTLPSVQNLIKKALKDTRFCRIQKTSF
ncbi:MAG: phage minor capsid protein, partial [Ruthenibacterium sp.]